MSTYVRTETNEAPALLFDQVAYSVDKRSLFSLPPCINKRKQIIQNCSGIVRQGEIVAILGSSGAGKSTLLDVLAKRKTYGNIEGTILYNGKVIKKNHLATNIAGYVRQEDYHLANLTVRQTLMYAADLRCRVSDEEKKEKVEYLIKALSLKHAANSKVGDKATRGISGGESRRLSIGIEMLNDPDLLFLDEPTSGLDSASSKNVVLLLRRLVRTRRNAAMCTIHQPSREVFEYFDKVILLGKSEAGIGTIAYFGPAIGVIPYFTRLGFPPRSAKVNPADHMIQLCSYKRDASLLLDDEEEEKILLRERAQTQQQLGIETEHSEHEEVEKAYEPNDTKVQHFIDSYQQSEELSDCKAEIEEAKNQPPNERDTTWRPLRIWSQILVLTRRSGQSMINDRTHLISRAVILLFLGIILCTGYWRLSYDAEDVQNRVSLIFFLLLSAYFVSEPFFALIPKERILVNHERGAKLYGTIPYFISTILVHIPFQVYLAQIYLTCVYWTTNLRGEFVYYSIFLTEFSLMVTIMIFYALMLGALCPNVEAALGLSAIFFTVMLLFNGFFLIDESIPPWWIWANWISPYKYSFYVALVNEFEGKEFDSCNGENCGYANGDELLDFYGCTDYGLKWPYIAVSLGWALVFALMFYIFLRSCRHEKR